MKKLTSLLFVLILIIGSLYMGVSKWDMIVENSQSLSFLRDEKSYSKIEELELKISKLNSEIKQLKADKSQLVYEKELSENNFKNYKKYSSQLREYAETLVSKYNILEAQHLIKVKESSNQEKSFNVMNDKVSKYNRILNNQQNKISILLSKIEKQSQAIQNFSDLSTFKMNQINTILVKQQEESSLMRSPANTKVEDTSKKVIVPKKVIKYLKPVDKFN